MKATNVQFYCGSNLLPYGFTFHLTSHLPLLSRTFRRTRPVLSKLCPEICYRQVTQINSKRLHSVIPCCSLRVPRSGEQTTWLDLGIILLSFGGLATGEKSGSDNGMSFCVYSSLLQPSVHHRLAMICSWRLRFVCTVLQP